VPCSRAGDDVRRMRRQGQADPREPGTYGACKLQDQLQTVVFSSPLYLNRPEMSQVDCVLRQSRTVNATANDALHSCALRII
jgi:hypothetical protein